jgi:serine/threonine protein kinase
MTVILAPEVIKAEAYSKEVDLWSIGVITYFMYVMHTASPKFSQMQCFLWDFLEAKILASHSYSPL